MLIRKNRTIFVQYLLIYILIASGGSAWGSFLGNDTFVMLIFIIGAFFLIFLNKGKIERKFGMMILLCTIFCLLAMCYSTLSIGTYMNFMGKILLSYAVIRMDEKNFAKRYIKTVYIMAIISCVIFIMLQVVGFETLSPLYTKFYTNPADGDYDLGNGYGLLVYRFVPLHARRNCGIFTEPGEYAIVLAVALFFVLFEYDELEKKTRDKIFLVLLLTMITVQSTSGYFMLGIILVVAIVSKKIAILRSIKLWGIVICVIALFGPKLAEMYNNTITNKIITGGVINLGQGTALARSLSITSVFSYILEHPASLLGLGFDRIQSIGLGSCAGMLSLLLAIGVFAFTIFYGYLLVEGKNNIRITLLYVVGVGIFLISGLSQPGTGFAVCYLMFMVRKCFEKEELYEERI